MTASVRWCTTRGREVKSEILHGGSLQLRFIFLFLLPKTMTSSVSHLFFSENCPNVAIYIQPTTCCSYQITWNGTIEDLSIECVTINDISVWQWNGSV